MRHKQTSPDVYQQLAAATHELARLRRYIATFPARPWLETDHPDVVACMGSAPACAASGCQFDARPASQEEAPETDVDGILQSVLMMFGLPGYRVEWFDANGNWDFGRLRRHGLDARLAEIRALAAPDVPPPSPQEPE